MSEQTNRDLIIELGLGDDGPFLYVNFPANDLAAREDALEGAPINHRLAAHIRTQCHSGAHSLRAVYGPPRVRCLGSPFTCRTSPSRIVLQVANVIPRGVHRCRKEETATGWFCHLYELPNKNTRLCAKFIDISLASYYSVLPSVLPSASGSHQAYRDHLVSRRRIGHTFFYV